MIRRTYASYLLGGLCILFLASIAESGEYVGSRIVTRIGDRCSQLGEGFVDVGNGVCGRVNRSSRIYVGPRNTTNPWTRGGTSSAALRSDGAGMLPGVATAQRLRVRGNLESYSPFR